MSRRLRTTEAIETPSKVTKWIDVFDFFFVISYMFLSFAFKSLVHSKLTILFFVFSFFMACFLTMKSSFNKRRRNYESIYFLLTLDKTVYRPYVSKENRNEKEE